MNAIPNLLTTPASSSWLQTLGMLITIVYSTTVTCNGDITPGPVQILQHIDPKMALDRLKRFSGSDHVQMAKEEGSEIGGKSFQVAMQVWYLWKEIQKKGLSRKSLIPQHSTEKVSARLKGSPYLLEESKTGEEQPLL